MTEQQINQPKTSKTPATAFASLACFIIAKLCFFINEPDALFIVAILTSLAGPILAITATFQAITRHCKARQYILPAAALILWVSVIALYMISVRSAFHRMYCGAMLAGLDRAMLVYAHDHEDQLPDPNKWCDLLISEEGMVDKLFICKASGAKPGQSSYALNKALIAMDPNSIPEDAVLLFEAKLTPNSWNQIAGPNDVAIENHKIGINVAFADGHVDFIKTKDIPNLNWNPKPQLPSGENK